MADQTTLLDVLVEGQSQTRTAANELFDPMSPAAIFGRRAVTSGGLSWGYYGGRFTRGDGTSVAIANGVLTLPANDVCYVQVSSTGTVSYSTVGFSGSQIPLYRVTTGASTVTDYIDYRDGTQGNAAVNGFTAGPADPVPYDCGGSYNGAPTASLVLMRYPFPRAVDFPSSLTSSRGVAGTAATAQTNFDLRKNGTSFGTMRFAAGATTATFISASGASFAAGDVLTIVAPATPDTTLADLGWTLAGTY